MKEILNQLKEKYNESKNFETWDDFPSLEDVPDIDIAADRIFKAVRENQKILIVSDSDCDGVGSAYIIKRFFNMINYKNVDLIMAERQDGYGFQSKRIIPFEPDLIITTDNGIAGKEQMDIISEKLPNSDMIITDHHTVDKNSYPDKAFAVVNPQRLEGDNIWKEVSGAVVIWLIIKHINDKNYFSFDPKIFLEELCLTTISDVMPLQHINRFLVKEGLKHFNMPRKEWVKILYNDLVKYDKEVLAEGLAFGVAPMINAAGRYSESHNAYNLLISKSKTEAKMRKEYLQMLNDQRKEEVANYMQIIENSIDFNKNKKFWIFNGKGFKKGLLGILAGKLAEKLKSPVLFTTDINDTECAGSGRSVEGVDLLGIIKGEDGVVKAGGHSEACGVTLEKSKIKTLNKKLHFKVKALPPVEEPIRNYVSLEDITLANYNNFRKFEPYGKGWQKPVLSVEGYVSNSKQLGAQKNHTVITIENNGKRKKGMYFFNTETFSKGEKVVVDFTIMLDSYSNGVQMKIIKIKNIL